jgi:hypothetical protein
MKSKRINDDDGYEPRTESGGRLGVINSETNLLSSLRDEGEGGGAREGEGRGGDAFRPRSFPPDRQGSVGGEGGKGTGRRAVSHPKSAIEKLAQELQPLLVSSGTVGQTHPSNSKSGFMYLCRRTMFGRKWKLVWVTCDVGHCTVYSKRPEAASATGVPSRASSDGSLLFSLDLSDSILGSVVSVDAGGVKRWCMRVASRNGIISAELGCTERSGTDEWYRVLKVNKRLVVRGLGFGTDEWCRVS